MILEHKSNQTVLSCENHLAWWRAVLCDETEITLYGTRIPRVGGNVISQGCEDAPGDKSLGLLMGHALRANDL